MGDVSKVFCPKEYHQQFIRKRIRSDGRRFDEFRPMVIQAHVVSTSDGSAMVRQGDTLIIASVKAELGVPRLEFPDQGRAEVHIQLSLAKSDFVDELRICQMEENFCVDAIQILLDNGILVDLKALCIEKSKICWVLRCDILILDGLPSIDGILVALSTALHCTTLPSVILKEPKDIGNTDLKLDDDFDLSNREDENLFTSNRIQVDYARRREIKLNNAKPIASSYLLIPGRLIEHEAKSDNDEEEGYILSDPSAEEIKAFSDTGKVGSATIIVGENQTLCGIYLTNLSSSDDVYNMCLQFANNHRELVNNLISEACAR